MLESGWDQCVQIWRGTTQKHFDSKLASFHLVALKNIVEDFKSQHPCWSSGMKNKGWGHNFGIWPAKEYHNSRQTKEWQMLVCFLDDPLQNGCLVVIIICNQGYTATTGQHFNMGNLWENTYFSQTRISFKINCIWIIITEWPCYTVISSDGHHIRTLFNIYWIYLY